MIGKCECGACSFDFPRDLCPVAFVCFCSMCTDRTYIDPLFPDHMGQGWCAIPKFEYLKGSSENVKVTRTSPFASRGRCKLCDSPLTMQYDCEINTTWVALDTLARPEEHTSFFASLPEKAYIHVPAVRAGEPVHVAEDIKAYSSWEPWLEFQDPCRPTDQRAPEICHECFLLKASHERTCSCERDTHQNLISL